MMNALQAWQYRAAMQRRGVGVLQFRRRGMGRLGALGGLDPATIASYAANAGFSGGDLYTAAAIALAESTGNPNAYNPETAAKGGTPTGKGSYGLWQIYLKMHPEFAGWNLYDPQTNANAAYSIYAGRGNNFTDWSTYNSQAFQKYIPAVTASAAQPTLPTPLPPAQSTDASVLTIDASTGQPIESTVDTSQLFNVSPSTPASSGTDNALLYGTAALAALVLLGMRE